MTKASLKSRYRNTFSGLMWVMLYPVITYLVQVFAFTVVFQVKSYNYPVYLLAGLIPWIFLVQSVEMCTGSYLQWGSFLKNIPIPPIVVPMIQLFDNFINYFVAYFFLIAIFLIKGNIPLTNVFFLIFPIFFFLIFTISLCISFSVLNVKFRDLKFILSFIFSLLFYLTPVFYKIDLLPEYIRKILIFSPFYIMIRPFQELLMNGHGSPFLNSLLNALFVSAASFISMLIVWKKFRNNIIFYG